MEPVVWLMAALARRRELARVKSVREAIVFWLWLIVDCDY